MLLQAATPSAGGGQSSGRPPENEAQEGVVVVPPAAATWTSHTTREGRLYYCNHVTKVASWLPPSEKWANIIGQEGIDTLPYGWEQAIDADGKPYFINHVNKTTTYEAPMMETWYSEEVAAPTPRQVVLNRSPTRGFGFVAGSERPVIVRFVTENGPSVEKLLPGDEILTVNGEDVRDAPREKVISMVRASETSVELVVCQPMRGYCTSTLGRKSTLLSAGKRARLRARPSRVRFAESVCVNGAPLFPPSAFSLGEMCAPPMANVLKVFLENGQTKSFKYDANTTVQDVVTSLHSKLCLTATEHFSLVVEHVKSLRRNKLTLLDPQDTLARIASRPGAHKLRCLFRVAFVPVSTSGLAQRDPAALDYLYAQCCNDVIAERFAPELQPEPALRLAALHMHQHAIVNNMPPQKLTVKSIEREFGLERFLPPSLLENMKRKKIRRLIAHFLRSYCSLGSPGQTSGSGKALTPLQAKLLYLDLVSQLPSYGAKCFSAGPPRIATPTDCIERVLLVSPRFGLSQIASGHNAVPVPIARLEDMRAIEVKREDDVTCSVHINLATDRSLHLSLEERDACELALVLQGYHRVLSGKVLPVEREREPPADDLPPPYLAQHNVVPSKWSYVEHENLPLQRAMFISPPPYNDGTNDLITSDQTNGFDTIKRAKAAVDYVKPLNGALFNVDNNMNSQMSNKNQIPNFNNGYDFEMIESGTFTEARNDEVIRRLHEMHQLVKNSEQYLTEQERRMENGAGRWTETNVDGDSDSDSQVSGIDDAPGPLKHSDSLLLLTQTQHAEPLDLNGLADSLQSESETESLNTPTSSPVRQNSNHNIGIRTSFGLHSPDNNCKNKQDLKEYLKQLREHAQIDNEADITNLENTLGIYELDPDIIDLTLIPPPQTPDELDDFMDITKAAPPSCFADSPRTFSLTDQNGSGVNMRLNGSSSRHLNNSGSVYENSGEKVDDDLDKFLASVTVQPPTLQVTPAIELTPEEILSYIIPPPPQDQSSNTSSNSSIQSTIPSAESPVKGTVQQLIAMHENLPKRRNSSGSSSDQSQTSNHIIDYSTVDRKSAFSCCGKSIKKKEVTIKPLPKCQDMTPPERPPKSNVLNRQRSNSCSATTEDDAFRGPELPPRENHIPVHILLPPKKPPLPPVPSIELRNKIKSPGPVPRARTASIGSPHLQRSTYKDIEHEIESPQSVTLFSCDKKTESKRAVSTPTSPHMGRNAKLSSVPIETCDCNESMRVNDVRKHSLSREMSNGTKQICSRTPCSKIRNELSPRLRDTLLSKSDVALAGLLVRLDQVAAQCSAAQARGGGTQMCEDKFQKARDDLTSFSLQLVNSSKCVVVAMACPASIDLPEHLAACLTILRRLTELAQDLSIHTSAPLQTRNLILKVHSVTAAFRELVNATITHSGTQELEERLAQHAECLANVLATLLRSLRVFSP